MATYGMNLIRNPSAISGVTSWTQEGVTAVSGGVLPETHMFAVNGLNGTMSQLITNPKQASSLRFGFSTYIEDGPVDTIYARALLLITYTSGKHKVVTVPCVAAYDTTIKGQIGTQLLYWNKQEAIIVLQGETVDTVVSILVTIEAIEYRQAACFYVDDISLCLETSGYALDVIQDALDDGSLVAAENLSDYNNDTMVVGQEEEIISLISAYISDDTSLMGNFHFSYVASVNTELIVRIRDNDVTELYAPLVYSLSQGKGVIGIPHGYLQRAKGYHNFTVTAQVTVGTITIATRKLLYIIDGARVSYNVLDVGSTIYDISVRRLATEEYISCLYAICIDNGECVVMKANNPEQPGAAWVAERIISEIAGAPTDAVIEFDGSWDFMHSPYRFITETQPWIGWIDAAGALYARKLDDLTTLYKLAEGVSRVAVVRGWNNTFMPGNDHGLLFVYISSGAVYYRARAMQSTEEYAWEPATALTAFSGTAVEVNAFRTNDYRVGINVLDNMGVTHTYLTVRNWGGLASPIESLTTNIQLEVESIKITHTPVDELEHLTVGLDTVIQIKWGATANQVTRIENVNNGFGDWGRYIEVEVLHAWYSIPTVALYDLTGEQEIAIESASKTGDVWTIAISPDWEFGINAVEGDIRATFTGGLNEAGIAYDLMEVTFTPTNLVPPQIPVPEVEAIWNE